LRIFTAALATETNTFSPICIDRRAFEESLYAPPGQHPATPTLCTAPITVGRKVCAEKGWTPGRIRVGWSTGRLMRVCETKSSSSCAQQCPSTPLSSACMAPWWQMATLTPKAIC
jgi:hypothetical protein